MTETSNTSAEAMMRSFSVHEMGHFWVATLGFNIPAAARIVVEDDGGFSEAVCVREFSGTDFAAACVGWAGVVAEHLLNCVDARRTPLIFPLTDATIEMWHYEVLFHAGELSDTDEAHLRRFKPTLEACRFAFRILSKDLAGLSADADLLADRTRKAADARWQGVPKPEKFPATFADFLQLTVGGNDAEEKFRRFVRAGVEKFFAELALSREQRQIALESWTQIRFEKFRRGFSCKENWRGAALAYRDWAR